MEDIVIIQNISKRFKEKGLFSTSKRQGVIFGALDNINLNIKKGEIFCFLGPNGAGKTTLIKILCSLMLPDEGRVFIKGKDISKNEDIKSYIGLVASNERSFYWRLTGRQNLLFFGTLFDIFGQRLKDRVKEVSGLLNIEDELDKPFLSYSTGIKQRFNIARALLHNPEIIFLDDSTRDLDIPTKNKILDFVKNVLNKQNGKTIVFVSHRAEEFENFCDRLCIIEKGRIKTVGSIAELQRNTGLDKIEGIFNYYTKNNA